MMRVLLDTNIILDFVLNRPPFANNAAEILRAHEKGDIEGYISAITPVNLYYITRKMSRIRAEALTTNKTGLFYYNWNINTIFDHATFFRILICPYIPASVAGVAVNIICHVAE